MSTVSTATSRSSFDLDHSIGFKIELVERVLKRQLTRRFQEHGIDITPNQWVILYRLWKQNDQTQVDLSAGSFKDKANVTRIIDLLVKKGLVERRTDTEDRRLFRIHLMDEGRLLMESAPSIVADHIETSTYGIEENDLETAISVLEKILVNHG